MATHEELEEIFASVRCMLNEVLAVTEAKMGDLVRMFDAAYARRLEEIDDAISKLQQRRRDEERPLN